MTYPTRPLSIPIPLSALLPPCDISPSEALPSSLAVLGPLPPTTPIHLALDYLYLSDLPDFAASGSTETPRKAQSRNKERVLVITTDQDDFVSSVEEDDEDWLRDNGGDYTILDRLRRIDIR